MVGKLRRFEAYFATRRRCLHRVEKEIEDRTVEQFIIANDNQRGRWKQLSNRNVLGLIRVRSDQRGGVAHDLDDIQTPHGGDSGAREIEELRQQA